MTDAQKAFLVRSLRRKRRAKMAMAGINPFAKAVASTVPGGSAALQAHELAKRSGAYKKAGNSHAAKSAMLLAKAKKGDAESKAKIKTIGAAARKGDPKAKKTLATMNALNKATTKKKFILDDLYQRGIAP